MVAATPGARAKALKWLRDRAPEGRTNLFDALALVLDRDGRVLGRATEEFTQYYPKPGWVEHDPEEIWRVSLEVIGLALTDASLSKGDLRAVGITNQRETTVVWDRKTGKPVRSLSPRASRRLFVLRPNAAILSVAGMGAGCGFACPVVDRVQHCRPAAKRAVSALHCLRP